MSLVREMEKQEDDDGRVVVQKRSEEARLLGELFSPSYMFILLLHGK